MSKTIRLPDHLVKAIDKRRGDTPREQWVREALDKHLAMSDAAADLEPIFDRMFQKP